MEKQKKKSYIGRNIKIKKEKTMFKIVSRYVYTDIFEIIDSANCYEEALRLKYEYQSAFHNAYTIEIVEV